MFETTISRIYEGKSKKYINNNGNAEKLVFTQFVNDRGETTLKPKDKIDMYAQIQSYAKECNINYIIKRYVNGDISIANQNVGTYGDFTEMPKSYQDFLNLTIRAGEYFDSLPPEERNKYGSLEGFLVSIDEKLRSVSAVEKPVENSQEVEKNETESE